MTLSRTLQEAAGNGISTGEVVEAIDFDGANDYLSRASDLTGNADGKTFTFSAWVWRTGLDTVYVYNAQSYQIVEIGTNGTLTFVCSNTGGSPVLNVTVVNAVPLYTMTHILVSVDLTNTSNRYIYVNDVLQTPTWTTYTNANVDFTRTAHYIDADGSGANPGQCRLSNVYLDYTYRDLSNVTNRRLFVTADLKPAADQATLAPILYLPLTDPTQPGLNLGTGGNFTLNGTVARSGRGPNQYNAPYSDLDGSLDYLNRTSITGIADSNKFTISWVMNFDSVDVGVIFYTNTTDDFYINVTNSPVSGSIYFQGKNSSGTNVLVGNNTSTLFKANRNYHVVLSIDLSDTAKRHLYINGETASITYYTYNTSGVIDFTPSVAQYHIGSGAVGSSGVNGRLGNVYFNTSYIDLSVADNLAKFVTGTGIDAKPVDLGATGELPTGSSPLIYLPMYGNNAGKNYGTGGDFTVNSGPYPGARGPNEFWGNKADFVVGQNLRRLTAFSGVTDNKTFSCSFWVLPDRLGELDAFMESSTAAGSVEKRFQILQLSDNRLRFSFYAAAGAPILSGVTSTTVGGVAAGHRIQISFDLSDTGKRQIYINGSLDSTTWSTYSNTNIGYPTWVKTRIGMNVDGNIGFQGKLSELYLTNAYIDFSQEANRLKFFDAFNNPVDLGADGSIPTGNKPIIYMRFDPASFGTNSGTGGDFTVLSAPSDGGQL